MAIVLGLRFVCEMAALAAVAYWGQQAAGGVAGIALAAIAVVVGGRGLGRVPRAQAAAGDRPATRLVIELAVWVAAAAALWSAGQPTLAVVLFVVAVVTGAINARTAPTTAPG